MPSGKTEQKAYLGLGRLAAAQPEEIRARRQAAEETYTGVLGRLGAPGTYDIRGGPAATGEAPSEDAEGGIFRKEKLADIPTTRYTKGLKAEARVLDPAAYQKEIEKSAQFRIMSRLTAESEQLIAREGPLYDEMLNSLQLPILEGAGAMARENTEQLRRAMARGGSARRGAMEAVQKIRAQERINSQKVMALSQSRFALDQWSRENARTNLEFGMNWAANQGGIRESYNQAMDKASELMLNSALPIMMHTTEKAQQWRYYAHNKNRQKVGRWISGIIGIGSMFLGGAGAMGISGFKLGLGGASVTIPTGGGEFAGQLASKGIGMLTEAVGGGAVPPTGGDRFSFGRQ